MPSVRARPTGAPSHSCGVTRGNNQSRGTERPGMVTRQPRRLRCTCDGKSRNAGTASPLTERMASTCACSASSTTNPMSSICAPTHGASACRPARPKPSGQMCERQAGADGDGARLTGRQHLLQPGRRTPCSTAAIREHSGCSSALDWIQHIMQRQLRPEVADHRRTRRCLLGRCRADPGQPPGQRPICTCPAAA